tara:strand:- start:2852 stop:5212 length:2361 start_codon:yes stop_codon:yes gene_type:complete
MNLTQQKLTKEEWDFLEIPLDQKEMFILKYINNNDNLNDKYNSNLSLIKLLKLNDDDKFHMYFYNTYYKKVLTKINKKYDIDYNLDINSTNIKKMKKADSIRISKYNKKDILKNDKIYENIIIKLLKSYLSNKKPKYYYTLYKLIQYNIIGFNKYIKEYVNNVLVIFKNSINKIKLLKKASEYIEQNEYLSRYKDITLYDHQKQLFNVFKNNNSKLVLYQAPTGTGKTISPLGLLNDYCIIFTCAAKHVGLQLAKSCISMEIPIAIAFGCETPDNIKLHYFAAKDFVKNRRTGGVFRVDNSQGQKVKLIITDIQSYYSAMNYMLAFNDESKLLWYWDEPTITLDYSEHSFHDILKKNWENNVISKIILSSATLPNETEIMPVLEKYKQKFNGETISIISYDCKKTIPLINSKGKVIVPHLYYDDYISFKKCVRFLEKNKTILRYVDLNKICEFIIYINQNIELPSMLAIDKYFSDINDININNIKLYYLRLCKIIKEEDFTLFKSYSKNKNIYDSCIKITTNDAYTLTNGPTIFMTNDVEKMALFYLKASNIPNKELDNILEIIDENMEYKSELEKIMKDEKERLAKINDKILDSGRESDQELKFQKQFNKRFAHITSKIKRVQLNSKYIPNSHEHYEFWHNKDKPDNVFTSSIDDEDVEKIISLDVNKEWKILLLMGIGVFTKFTDVKYLDVMKKLAEQQKLYLIIASSDYIYGTNYQFCHGYLAKDLVNLTQEKMIQALGRVGRKNIKNSYTIRIRDNNVINKLFLEEENKIEVENMNKLFGFS